MLSLIFRSEPKGLTNGDDNLSTLKLHKFNYSCEGSLHLATCWTWPSSSIEIGRRTKQAPLRQAVAGSSVLALDVIVTHLLNKLCSELEEEGLKDP